MQLTELRVPEFSFEPILRARRVTVNGRRKMEFIVEGYPSVYLDEGESLTLTVKAGEGAMNGYVERAIECDVYKEAAR
jgi:hypothetical protein